MSDDPKQNRRMTDSVWYWIVFWAVFSTALWCICYPDMDVRGSLPIFLLPTVYSLTAPIAKLLGLRTGQLIAPIMIGHSGAIILVLENIGGLGLGKEALTFTAMGAIASWVLAAAGWGWCVRTREDALGFGVWVKHALYYLLATALLTCLPIFLFERNSPVEPTGIAKCLVAYGVARTIPALVWRAIAKRKRARANPQSAIQNPQ